MIKDITDRNLLIIFSILSIFALCMGIHEYIKNKNSQNEKQVQYGKRSLIYSIVGAILIMATIFTIFAAASIVQEKRRKEKERIDREVAEVLASLPRTDEENTDDMRDKALQDAYEGRGAYDNVKGW